MAVPTMVVEKRRSLGRGKLRGGVTHQQILGRVEDVFNDHVELGIAELDVNAVLRDLKVKYKNLRRLRATQRSEELMIERGRVLLNRFDVNGDGQFEFADFLTCVHTCVEEAGHAAFLPSDEELALTFKDLSFEKEGFLQLKELRQVANIFIDIDIIMLENEIEIDNLRLALCSPTRFRKASDQAFAEVDIDETSTIDIGEFGKVLNSLSQSFGIEPPSPKVCHASFRHYDLEEDGFVDRFDFKPFCRMVFHLSLRHLLGLEVSWDFLKLGNLSAGDSDSVEWTMIDGKGVMSSKKGSSSSGSSGSSGSSSSSSGSSSSGSGSSSSNKSSKSEGTTALSGSTEGTTALSS